MALTHLFTIAPQDGPYPAGVVEVEVHWVFEKMCFELRLRGYGLPIFLELRCCVCVLFSPYSCFFSGSWLPGS